MAESEKSDKLTLRSGVNLPSPEPEMASSRSQGARLTTSRSTDRGQAVSLISHSLSYVRPSLAQTASPDSGGHCWGQTQRPCSQRAPCRHVTVAHESAPISVIRESASDDNDDDDDDKFQLENVTTAGFSESASWA